MLSVMKIDLSGQKKQGYLGDSFACVVVFSVVIFASKMWREMANHY